MFELGIEMKIDDRGKKALRQIQTAWLCMLAASLGPLWHSFLHPVGVVAVSQLKFSRPTGDSFLGGWSGPWPSSFLLS